MHLLLNYFIGAYVPLTMEGNIVVDGILASCYASFNHDIAHFAVAPMRRFPGLIQLIFGENNDYPVNVKIAKEIGKWLLPTN